MKKLLTILLIAISCNVIAQDLNYDFNQSIPVEQIQLGKFKDGFYGMLPHDMPEDYMKHFWAGYVISGATYTFINFLDPDAKNIQIKGIVISLAVTAVIAGGKELLYDKMLGQGHPSWTDFTGTMDGGKDGLITAIFTIETAKWFRNKRHSK